MAERLEGEEVDKLCEEFNQHLYEEVERWILAKSQETEFKTYHLAPVVLSSLAMTIIDILHNMAGPNMTGEECQELFQKFQGLIHETQIRNHERLQQKGVTIPLKIGGLV